MAAIDEHGELDAVGASEGKQCINRRARRPSRHQDVIDENDRAALEFAGKLRDLQRRDFFSQANVVAVHRRIHDAEFEPHLLDLPDESDQPLCDFDSARRDACERDFFQVGICLDDLVRHATQRALDRLRVENRGCGR